MDLQQAITLIAFENLSSSPQLWLDLGAGDGLFTTALAQHLPPASKIIAVDKNAKALRQVASVVNAVSIETVVANFMDDTIHTNGVDGILMANSLHYVKNKIPFLKKMAPLLKRGGSFLLVEYNRTRANPWVPYPLTIDTANELFSEAGYSNFKLLNKAPSSFGGEMFAAMTSQA